MATVTQELVLASSSVSELWCKIRVQESIRNSLFSHQRTTAFIEVLVSWTSLKKFDGWPLPWSCPVYVSPHTREMLQECWIVFIWCFEDMGYHNMPHVIRVMRRDAHSSGTPSYSWVRFVFSDVLCHCDIFRLLFTFLYCSCSGSNSKIWLHNSTFKQCVWFCIVVKKKRTRSILI